MTAYDPATFREFFIICPNCAEEAVITLRPGFNKADCPSCDFYFIVFLDSEGQPWTRVPGVLATWEK